MGDREEAPGDCTRCGACCFSESARHVRVTGDDHERLGDDAERVVTWIGNEAFLALAGDEGSRHCAALRLDARGGTFQCSVYERRPQICRDLERGGGGCLGELASKRGRPLLALARLIPRP